MKAIIYDTEVNSLEHMEPIEVAWMEVALDSMGLIEVVSSSRRYKPEMPIDLGAMAVHMIRPQDLEGSAPSSTAALPDAEFVIGHNIDFDEKVMKTAHDKTICTLALSRHLWPEKSSHKLGAMFLHCVGTGDEAMKRLRSAHEALADVRMTFEIVFLVCAMKGIRTFEELHALSEIARIPTVMPFGKHRTQPIADVPRDYVRWLLNQKDVDPYLRTALENR